MTGSTYLGMPNYAGWPSRRARYLFRVRRDKAKATDKPLTASQRHGVVTQERYEALSGNRVTKATTGLENFQHVSEGDFIISLRSFEGGLEYAFDSGCISPAYTVLQPDNAVDPGFFRHALKSSAFLGALQPAVTGIRDGKSVRYEDFAELSLPLPSLSTQRRIADFLDRETARIDELLEKKQRLINLIDDRVSAFVRRLVFGQDLTDNVYSHDVSWMPALPKGWLIQRLSRLFDSLDYRRIPLNSEERADLARLYPYYGASGVIDYIDDYLFDEDLLLVGEDGANLVLQSTPIAFIARGKYWVNNHAHVLRPRIGPLEYWVHVLNQVPYELYVTGSAQPKLTAEALRNIPMPMPPTEMQYSIADEITRQTAGVNGLRDKIRRSITKLRELRSSVITEAVTAQMDTGTLGTRDNVGVVVE